MYYIKGKDTVLSDILSRQNNNGSNPHEIIPISFNMYQVLHENYYNIENYLVQKDPKPDPVALNSLKFMAWERI